jgi:predicted nucleic acid-binding Zn ribbon protein
MGRSSGPPGRLGETLGRVVQRIDPEKRLDVYRLWTFWADEVGTSIAERAAPLAFRAGVLSVRVSSHSWMQELQFMKETIRERLNARLGGERIRDIYFVSAPEAEVAPARKKVEAFSPPEPVQPLPAIGDPQVASVFQRIVQAHARRHTRSNAGGEPKD